LCSYLLEKSRAIMQNKEERNFHAFYQLLNGADQNYISELHLEAASKYRFLSNGSIALPNVDDGKEFRLTNEAFGIIGLTDADIMPVWRVVSAVLQFGNIDVDTERRGGEQAVIKDDSVCQKVCHLLGLNVVDFTRSLINPRLKVGRDFVAKQQTKAQVRFVGGVMLLSSRYCFFALIA